MSGKETMQRIAALPIQEVPLGFVLDPVHPDEVVDKAFADWESPLVAPGYWHMLSLIEIARLPTGDLSEPSTLPLSDQVLRFNLQYEDPTKQGAASWGTRYDRALVTRDPVPADVTITTTVGIQNPLTTATYDNNTHVRPWIGIVGRMQDVRHYYFFCLEYPEAAVLYRREDSLWIPLARYAVAVNCKNPLEAPHELRLAMKGNRLQGWVDGQLAADVTDYHYQAGKAGVRANCASHVASYVVEATDKAVTRHRSALAAQQEELEALASALPKPVLAKSFDLRGLGEVSSVQFGPFAAAAKPSQMLISLRGNEKGSTHVLRSYDGDLIWEARLAGMNSFILTEPRDDGHCDLFGMTTQQVLMVDGRSGEVIARRPLPTLAAQPALTWLFLPTAAVNLRGGPVAREYLIREGHNDGQNVWALDEELNTLWHAKVPVKFGHAYSVGACDIDGDGRDEILAGATLLSAEGEIIWTQPQVNELLKCPGGGHVDALAIGFFSGPDEGPVAHLQSSSAGNIVLDALTGEIIAVHPQGHTQGRNVGKFVPEEPGLQVLVGCRWGNYGLLSFYSADGRRLHTFQPDYVGQSGPALNWSGDGLELAAIASDARRSGGYDHLGRRALDLTAFLPQAAGIYHGGQCLCQDVCGDARDEIILRTGGLVNIVTQETALAPGARVYTPFRRWSISYPAWGKA